MIILISFLCCQFLPPIIGEGIYKESGVVIKDGVVIAKDVAEIVKDVKDILSHHGELVSQSLHFQVLLEIVHFHNPSHFSIVIDSLYQLYHIVPIVPHCTNSHTTLYQCSILQHCLTWGITR